MQRKRNAFRVLLYFYARTLSSFRVFDVLKDIGDMVGHGLRGDFDYGRVSGHVFDIRRYGEVEIYHNYEFNRRLRV